MITLMDFDNIKYYWETYLWSKYADKGYRINKVNTTTQKDYSYGFLKYLTQDEVEKIILPTYISYIIDDKVVGVYSGYKTNIDYYRLRGLWVNEQYRNRRIATRMMNYLIAHNRKGNKYVWTIPRESSLGFYLKF